MNLLEFKGYVVFIDGMFIKICKLWNDGANKVWFNGHYNIYSMNNTVVVDHQCLFIYLDLWVFRFLPWCYHFVLIWTTQKFESIFLHDDKYFEHFLGDLGYLSEEMFVMRRIGKCEVGLMLIKMLLELTTKYMLGIKCEFSGGLVDWKGNGDN